MKNAAVAASLGWDPLRYLALESHDELIALAVLEEQLRVDDARFRDRADYLAGRIAEKNGGAITRWLGRALRLL